MSNREFQKKFNQMKKIELKDLTDHLTFVKRNYSIGDIQVKGTP